MNRKTIIVFILLLAYFMIPKIDLFFVEGSVTGIRLQDFISLFLFLILFDLRIKVERMFFLLIMTAHLLYSIAVWDTFTSIYGFFRLIEYFFVAKGIVMIIESGYWRIFFNYIFIFILIMAIGQYIDLLPNFDPGRGMIYSRQFSGPFGTPAELTYFMIAATYLTYIVDRVGMLKFVSSSLVLFNGVKAGIFGFLILALQRMNNINYSFIFILLILSFVSVFLIYDYLLIGFEFLQGILNKIIVSTGATSQSMNITEISEQSLGYRTDKWTNTFVQLIQNPLALFFGFGVYSYTSALDGGIIKFLFEFGLLALLWILFTLFRLSKSFFFIVLATSLLFDSYTSSVIMPVLMSTFLVINRKMNHERIEE